METTTLYSTQMQRLQQKTFINESIALNKLYHYPYDNKMIFDLAMTLINGAIQEDVCQMKEAEYIKYIIELAGFDYEDEVETYHQMASHTYLIQEAQIQ
ncbi:hypothetical protein G9A89_010901 [Geosiphon pyriformis]|nr:hypothetical protein G9A89_010901 [Geosiphon pyriformis]